MFVAERLEEIERGAIRIEDQRREDGRLDHGLEAELPHVEQGRPRLDALVEQREPLVLVERTPAHGVTHEAQAAERQILARGPGREERRVVAERDPVEGAIVVASDGEHRLVACTLLEGGAVVARGPVPEDRGELEHGVELEPAGRVVDRHRPGRLMQLCKDREALGRGELARPVIGGDRGPPAGTEASGGEPPALPFRGLAEDVPERHAVLVERGRGQDGLGECQLWPCLGREQRDLRELVRDRRVQEVRGRPRLTGRTGHPGQARRARPRCPRFWRIGRSSAPTSRAASRTMWLL